MMCETAIERCVELLDYAPEQPRVSLELNRSILGVGGHDVRDTLNGKEIIGKCSDVEFIRPGYLCAFVDIGDNEHRKYCAEHLFSFHFLVSKMNVGASTIGAFCIISPEGLVNVECVVNSYALIDSGAIVKGFHHTRRKFIRNRRNNGK